MGTGFSRNAEQEPSKGEAPASRRAPLRGRRDYKRVDEGVTTNPPLSRSVQVRDKKIRVLLVDGSPVTNIGFLHMYWTATRRSGLHTVFKRACRRSTWRGRKIEVP